MTDSGVKRRFFLLLSGSVQLLAQFPVQRRKGARVEQNYLRSVPFHPHFSMGLALSDVESPKRTEFVLSGVRWAKFQGLLHEEAPPWRLKGRGNNSWIIGWQKGLKVKKIWSADTSSKPSISGPASARTLWFCNLSNRHYSEVEPHPVLAVLYEWLVVLQGVCD